MKKKLLLLISCFICVCWTIPANAQDQETKNGTIFGTVTIEEQGNVTVNPILKKPIKGTFSESDNLRQFLIEGQNGIFSDSVVKTWPNSNQIEQQNTLMHGMKEYDSNNDDTEGAIKDIPLMQVAPKNGTKEAISNQIGTEGAVKDIPQMQVAPKNGTKEAIPNQIGAEGEIKDIPQMQVAPKNDIKEAIPNQIGTEGAIKDIPQMQVAPKNGTKEAIPNLIGTEGAIKDIPQMQVAPKNDIKEAIPNQIGTEGAIKDIPQMQVAPKNGTKEAIPNHIGTDSEIKQPFQQVIAPQEGYKSYTIVDLPFYRFEKDSLKQIDGNLDTYGVYGIINAFVGGTDADTDGYYETYTFQIGIDGDAIPGPAIVYGKMKCITTGQSWWSASPWTITGIATDYYYFGFDETDFSGYVTGNTNLDFTVELWNSTKTTLLASDASVSGEPVKADYIAPINYSVYGIINNFVGGADADADGYYETYTFQIGIDGDRSSGSATVYGKMICPTTGQSWWSSSSWTITGTATDYHYFGFSQTDFSGYVTGNTNLDFTVELWNSSKTTLLASDATVSGEPVKADYIPPTTYNVIGIINNFVGGTDADADGYYETYTFQIGIDADATPGPTTIYGKMICTTTGQSWWSSTSWTVTGTTTDYHYFNFSQSDFAGYVTGNTNLDFTVEMWNSTKTTLLDSDASVSGEPVKADYIPPTTYNVIGIINNFVGGADADADGYYETYTFQIGIDADATPGPTTIYGKMICTTTGQSWWSSTSWTVTGTTTDYHYFNFSQSDFSGYVTGNTNLDFTVEMWNSTKTTLLDSDASVSGEPVKADYIPTSTYDVFGIINAFVGGTDADSDGYYETYSFQIGIDGDANPGPATVYGKMICNTTGQSWWSSASWTVTGATIDYHYFGFDQTNFSGYITGNTNLDFTVELWNSSKTTLLASDATVSGEPVKVDYIPVTTYAIYGIIDNFVGGTDADADGYYETYTFQIGIDGDATPGPATVYGKMICPTTGQSWWSSSSWTITGTVTDYQYFNFSQTDFSGYVTGNTSLEFTVELWNSTKTTLLASDASVSGEPVKADYIAPINYSVYGIINNFVGGADADADGYYETYTFQIGIDGDRSSGSATVYGKMICPTTGQSWWSSSSWTITGTATDYQYFGFSQTDFSGYVTGNTNLDFTVELWNSTKTTLLASDAGVTGEPVKADYIDIIPPDISVNPTVLQIVQQNRQNSYDNNQNNDSPTTTTPIISKYCEFEKTGIQERLYLTIENSNSDSLIPVIIQMDKIINFEYLIDKYKNIVKNEKKAKIIFELKEFSELYQSNVINYLSSLTFGVNNVQVLWSINSIGCELSPSVIQIIGNYENVACIWMDDVLSMPFNETLIDPQDIKENRANVWNLNLINADDVWNLGYNGSGVVCGLIDTGVNYDHTDLQDHMWNGGSSFPNHGFDFINNDNDPMDTNGHGTHCAGTVAGDGSSGTSTGVAPNCQVMAVKAVPGSLTVTTNAVQFCLDHGADLISMSAGWAYYDNSCNFQSISNDLRISLRNLGNTVLSTGIVWAVASGNDADCPGANPPDLMNTPADVPGPWQGQSGHSSVISVGATDSNDNIADFSNFGPAVWNISPNFNDYPSTNPLIKPNIVAPGVNITSLSFNNNTGYVSGWSGTSMATPHIAGVIALMLDKEPSLTPSQIDQILSNSAVDLGNTGIDNLFGAGRVNALAAINAMSGNENSFTITNVGGSVLTVTSISDNKNWLSTSGYPSSPFNIAAGGSQPVNISVDWVLVGTTTQTGTITIASNDPDETSVTVQVTVIPTIQCNLTVTPSNRNVTYSAGSTTFSVTSNCSWTASSNQTWCTVTPSGTGNGTITATYTENPNTSQRIANITVTVDGVTPIVVTVTQAARPCTLAVTPSNQNVTYSAGTTNFSVTSNCSWTALSNQTWCTITPSGNGNGTLTANYTINNTANTRIANITVTVSGIAPVVVTVTQAPMPTLSVSPSNRDVPWSPEGSTTFSVTSNSNWTASSSQTSWCTVTPSGSGNGTIIANYTVNNTASTRIANITVTVSGIAPVVVTVTQGSPSTNDILTLNAGWNLISFDITLNPNTPAEVFQTLITANNLQTVTGYQNQQGVFFDPTGLPFLNTLQSIIQGEGYWVKVQNAATLTVQGTAIPANLTINLLSGWNLISYWRPSTTTPATAFAALISAGKLQMVTGYEQGGKFFDPNGPTFLNTLTEIKNGFGYWVKVNSNCTLTFP